MKQQVDSNVIEFPAEYLIEQRKQDRWLTIASCSIVLGSDEPMAYVQMILDKFGDGPHRSPAEIVAHARFAARPVPPEALDEPDEWQGLPSADETVFNEWIDAWLFAAPH